MGPASRKLGAAGRRAGGRRAERASAGRGRREGDGWHDGRVGRSEPDPIHSRAHPPTRTTPATGSPTPSPRAPGGGPPDPCPAAARESAATHARRACVPRAAARRGRSAPPAPAGRPRRSGSEREADRGARPGDSRARAAAAPTHPSGGSRAGARPRAPPAGAGAGVAHRHSTARGKATKAGRHARPARDGGPGPGTRAPGRAPPPDPGEGRATGQAEADLQRTHRTDTCPGRTTGPRSGAHTRRTGQHHAGRGRASPDDANNARDRRLGDRAAAGPGSEAHHGGGRASTGCGRAGREKTRHRARQAAKRGGGGAPRDPLQRGQPPPGHAHGGLTASSLRARRRPRVAPGAADRPSAIPAAPPPPPQSHAVRAPGTRLPPHAPQGRPKRSGRPPGPHAGRRRPGPEGTRHGDADAGPSSGRRRRPHKAEPGSGPDGAANSVKAGEPLGEVRIDRRRAGERGTRQARSQGARGTRARGTRREGCSGKKPQARPGHQENTATGSHRHRHEGGPAAPRLGRRTALRQPTEQPLTSPGSRHQGPRSNLSHKPNTRGHTSLVSRLPPTRSLPLRETGAHPAGTFTPPRTRRPNPGATQTRSSAPVAARHGSGRRAGSQRNAARTRRSRQPPSR